MPSGSQNRDVTEQIIALVTDSSKIQQLTTFIEHAKTMHEAMGINLLNTRDKYLRNLITLSIMHDNLKATQMLIDAGVDLNEGDMIGVTPLHAAVLLNRPSAVDVLISKGADLNKTDLNAGGGDFDLSDKANAHQKKIYEEYRYRENEHSFLDYYGNENDQIKTPYNTPIYMACVLGREEIYNKLVAAGAKLSVSFEFDQSPLCAAAYNGNVAIVKDLLERQDVDIDFVGEDDFSAVDIAVLRQQLQVLELLLAKKARGVAYWLLREYYICNGRTDRLRFVDCNKKIIELYVSKTIDNYLSDIVNDKTLDDKDIVDFHFNQNTEVFCDFVKYQFTSEDDHAVNNIPAVSKVCYVQLPAEHLHLLLKILLSITLNTSYPNSELLPEAVRQALLADLCCEIGVHLYGQENPAAYLFLKKAADKPKAQHLLVNMLLAEIKLSQGEKPTGLYPEMTLEKLEKDFPQGYAQAEVSLQGKADAFLNPAQQEPTPAAEVICRVAKRHRSPLHRDDEQPSSKAVRLEEQIPAKAELPLPAPAAKR